MKFILLTSTLLSFISFSQTKEEILKTAKDSLYSGNAEYVIELLNNFIKTDSTSAEVYYLLAESKLTTGMNDLNKALSLDSMHVESLNLRGRYYYFEHQPELALKDYSRAYEISGDCNQLGMVAKIKTELGDYDGAFSDYTFMLNKNAEGCSYIAHFGLARYYFLLGKYEDVVSEFEQFNIHSIVDADNYLMLAESYHKTGKGTDACETIHELVDFWPYIFSKDEDTWTYNEIDRLIKDCCK